VVVRVWKTPQGMPQRISPTSSCGSEWVLKKTMKMKQMTRVRAPIMVLR
jgi:hypothetical protein